MQITEIFYSLAGEGIRTGQATIFIRLAKCNLQCCFCDTRHDSFTEMDEEQIIAEVEECPAEWVTLTGGEPTLQDCAKLVHLLKPKHKISIETNGTKYAYWLEQIDLVTVSPKEMFYPGAKVDEQIWDLSSVEAKFVITRPEDISSALTFDKDCLRFLQPMNNEPSITALCVDTIKRNPEWRLSLQMHKFIDIP